MTKDGQIVNGGPDHYARRGNEALPRPPRCRSACAEAAGTTRAKDIDLDELRRSVEVNAKDPPTGVK
jgi:hypothetical protein